MADSGVFCPRCGDAVETPPEPAPGEPLDPATPLCDACYLAEFELVDAPERVDLRICSRCGAVYQGTRWAAVEERDYTAVAVEVVREALGVHVEAADVSWGVTPRQIDQNTIEMRCRFEGTVRGRQLQTDVTVPVTFVRETCTRCGRIAGDYYAGVVQLRASDRAPTEAEIDRAVDIAERFVGERERKGDRDAFLTEIARQKGGVDVKVSTTKLAQGIATRIQRALGGTITDSRTLVTEDEDGEEVYRVTYAVRLPPYTGGDILAIDDDGPVLVTSTRGTVKGIHLRTGDRYEADAADGIAPEATRLGDVNDAVETTVVAVDDDRSVQVLDPETFETVTIPRPTYLNPAADRVPVFKSRVGLHVLPTDRV